MHVHGERQESHSLILFKYVTFRFVFFYSLFFINEDRNIVSSPPLQTVLIEEVVYVKKIIVTGGIHISYSSK